MKLRHREKRARRLAPAMLVLVGLCVPAAAQAAFPGTNGQIVFEGEPALAMDDDIFVMGPDGQSRLPLTQSAGLNDEDATFSADGEKIAWSVPFATDIGDDEIFVMGADGRDPVALTNNSVSENRPAFSPDGTRIVYARFEGDDDIWVMDANGQNQTPLTDNAVGDFAAVFSPNGTRIAFASNREGGDADVFVMDADGQNPLQLTQDPAGDRDPAFSPDGSMIAFESNRGGDNEIWVMNASGGNETPLTDDPAQDTNPEFSPDGQRIVFDSNRDGDDEILVMGAAGGSPTPVTNNLVSDSVPDWQPLNPPAIDLNAGTQKSTKSVTVAVVAQNENASVTLDGTLKAPKPKPEAAASRKKTVELDAVTVQLQQDVPATVEIPVAGRGAKLLKKSLKAGRKPKGTITASATDDLGAASSDSQDVKYKKKKKK